MSSGSPERALFKSRLVELSVLVLVPVAAALTLVAVVTQSSRDVNHELHLLAPDEIVSGQYLPLRAELYAELRRPEGAKLITPPVSVELRSQGGRAHARLKPSYAHSLDGALLVPRGLHGDAVLTARAELDAAAPRVERTVHIADDAAQLQLSERELPPLRRFAAAPTVTLDASQPAPSVLQARIAGGLCVPELPCEIFVHVGEPAAAIAIVPTPMLTLDPSSVGGSPETSGVVRLRFVTHGPEARLTLSVTRGGMPVASRALRLAVGLGANVVTGVPPIVPAQTPITAGLSGNERGCIIDGLSDGYWQRTGSIADCRGRERLPFAPLSAGLWRLQLRRDPFSAESAGVRSVYVRGARQSDTDVVRALAQAALVRDPHDSLAHAVLAGFAPEPQALDNTAGYFLALLDDGIMLLPKPTSSLPRAVLRQSLERARVRTIALFALALCALTLGLFIAQRGLAAAGQAGRLMTEAGEEPGQIERQRLRMTLRVLATVSSLLLAFLALAAYMLARSQGP